jgi:hypothetical protein
VQRRLLASLTHCPTLFTEWFWSGAFAFAVSSAYLGADNRADLQDVVAATLVEFSHLMHGVGIGGALLRGEGCARRASRGHVLGSRAGWGSGACAAHGGRWTDRAAALTPAAPGNTAWTLLLQLSRQHLSHLGPLPAAVQTALRAHSAHLDALAAQELAGAFGAPRTAGAPPYRSARPALPPPLPPGFAQLLGLGPAPGSADALSAAGAAAQQLPLLQGADGEPAAGSPGCLAAPLHHAAPGALASAGSGAGSLKSLKSASSAGLGGRAPAAADKGGAGACPAAAAATIKAQRGRASAYAASCQAQAGGRPAWRLQGQLGHTLQLTLLPRPEPPAGHEAWQSLCRPGALQWEHTHAAAVTAAAAANGTLATVAADGTLKVLHTDDGWLRSHAALALPAGGPAARRPAPAGPPRLALSPDGARLAVANASGCCVWVLDAKAAGPTLELEGESRRLPANPCPERGRLALAGPLLTLLTPT